MKPILILFVDDQPRHQLIYQSALEDSFPNATVNFVTSCQAAVTYLAQRTPDLMILDLDLPDASGEDLLATVKSKPQLAMIPVVILTGHTDVERQLRLLEQGADDFLKKGDAPEVFVARIQSQLRHKLALDQLERLAMERDIFAAGVLQEIKIAEDAIVAICDNVIHSLDKDAELGPLLARLATQGNRLGAYAANVISSLRSKIHDPDLTAQNIGPLVDWVISILGATGEGQRAQISWSASTPLNPILADENYLRLTLFNLIQFCLRRGDCDAASCQESPLRLTISQRCEGDFITTVIEDDRGAFQGDMENVFRPMESSEAISHFDIGLAMSAKLTHQMGGQIWAKKGAKGIGFGFQLKGHS